MREYTIEGPTGEYTVQLDDDEAKARGLKARAVENKARTAENKVDAPKKTAAQRRADVVERSFSKPPPKKATRR